MSTAAAGRAASGTVIVGTGVAGAQTALSLRAGGYPDPITLIGSEPHLPYRRPVLSKDVLLSGMAVQKALVKPADFWRAQEVVVRTRVTALEGDPHAHTLALSDGTEERYDALVLATGAAARRLPGVPAGDRVKYLRDYADAVALRTALDRADSVIVFGAGLIGSEVASAAVGRGRTVTVVEPAPRPLARVAPESVGTRLAKLHTDAGVRLLLGTVPGRVTVGPDAVRVALESGPLTADLLVVAIGSEPNVALAQRLGVRTDDGIVVDAGYRTSVADVYAAGDCARLPHPLADGGYRAENWSAAQDQGAALAGALLGGACAPTVPWGWSNQFGALVQFAGWPGGHDRVELDGEVEGAFILRCRRDEHLVGAVAIGRPKDLRAVRGDLAADVRAVRS